MTGNNRLTVVANSCGWLHKSRYIAIYYIVMKLDINEQTHDSVVRKHITYCMHTGWKTLICESENKWRRMDEYNKVWVCFWYNIFFTNQRPENRITCHLLPVCLDGALVTKYCSVWSCLSVFPALFFSTVDMVMKSDVWRMPVKYAI